MPDPIQLLYPAPRRCVHIGPGFPIPGEIGVSGVPHAVLATVPGLTARVDARGPVYAVVDGGLVEEPGDEAYALTIRPARVDIAARTQKGIRWALATLAQLCRAGGTELPGVRIDDAPLFQERGFMLDISRDRVPTMETLRSLIDGMALLKMNHLQLYNEHAFAYRGHEGVWRSADPITPDEMREIDAYARERGIGLHANQNTFGHFERWLRHPAYASMGELSGPHLYEPWHHVWMEASTLCPDDPRSVALIEDLLTQMIPCCSGAYVNIGGDEPVDLGLGRSAGRCAAAGRGRVFTGYIGRIMRIAQRLGRRPQFWCDPHPNEDGELPQDIIALVWGYGSETDFSTRLGAHRAAGREVWVAPGTNNWNTYAGRTEVRRRNLSKAVRGGIAHGAVGCLTTEWGDQGHRQQWPLTLMGMADGAQAAWSGDAGFDGRAAGFQVLGSPELGNWLTDLGCADHGVVPGDSPTFIDAGHAWGNHRGIGAIDGWKKIASACALVPDPPCGTPFTDECRLALDMVRYAAERAVVRRECDGSHGAELPFRRRLADLAARYRAMWLMRSRYGGLEDSYGKLIAAGR